MATAPQSYRLLRRLLFRLEPETAHALALTLLRLLGAAPGLAGALRRRNLSADARLEQSLWGRTFPHPVGLAAGFDKDGLAVDGLAALGFSFLELGTVTPRPQPGNPRPRLRRLPEAASLQNALGFNNRGAGALAARLRDRRRPPPLPLGINIGKDRDTPLERAAEDYLELMERLSDRCDFFVINLSSPNTPGLRELQRPAVVESLLRRGREVTRRPLLLKLSPDLEPGEAARLAAAAVDAGAGGLVLTNTTTDYSLAPGAPPWGGLSGAVLRERSYAVLREVAAEVRGRTVLVSVGGIDSGCEVHRRLRAGARLVEVYTALVYRGPALVARIQRQLLELLERQGADGIDDIIGVDWS